MKPLSTGQKIIFAIGQLGWVLAGFAPGSLLLVFYYTPEQSSTVYKFGQYIPLYPVLFGLTYLGLIMALGRVFDAITDPWIANIADKYRAKYGRNRFLLLASVPTALSALFMFVPIVNKVSIINVIWLTFWALVYNLSITCYCAPYNALICEYGHTQQDRVTISTFLSLAWLIGTIIGNSFYILFPIIKNKTGFNDIKTLHTFIGSMAGLGILAMLTPAIFIPEKKHALQVENEDNSPHNFKQNLKLIGQNKNYLNFIGVEFFWCLGSNFFYNLVIYIIVAILLLDPSYNSKIMYINVILSFILIPFVLFISKYFKKKKLLMYAYVSYLLAFVIALISTKIQLTNKMFILFLIIGIIALPGAILGILPNAIIAELSNENTKKTGVNLSAMFFAARTFMQKVGVAGANLILPSLLVFGKSSDNPTGIIYGIIGAIIFTLCTIILLTRFKEPSIN